jgi:hypothetical protein
VINFQLIPENLRIMVHDDIEELITIQTMMMVKAKKDATMNEKHSNDQIFLPNIIWNSNLDHSE